MKVTSAELKEQHCQTQAPLTWSIASCSITIAPSISFCCDADNAGHSPFEPTARTIFNHRRLASSNSFSALGGSSARHSGHASDTPFARSSATHPVQNQWPHGSLVGSTGGSRQIRHLSASNAASASRSSCAWAAAARTWAWQVALWPRFQWRR